MDMPANPKSDSPAEAMRFLTKVWGFDAGMPQVVAFCGHYDAEQFHPDLFTVLGVQCPDRLTNAVVKRQAEYLVGRRLARSALEALCSAVVDIPTGEGGAPQWPSGIAGSISHSHGVGVCLAVADADMLVGIDVEMIASEKLMTVILRRTLNDSECDLIEDLPLTVKRTMATLVFSAKETLYKLLYPVVGRYFGFSCAEIRALPDAGMLRLYLTSDLHPSLPKGVFFDLMYSTTVDQVMTWAVISRSALPVPGAPQPV